MEHLCGKTSFPPKGLCSVLQTLALSLLGLAALTTSTVLTVPAPSAPPPATVSSALRW
jgi:hypothetical protein